jgi:hypothetical protein
MSAASPVRPFGDFLRLLIAPTIWFAHFSLLYAAEALICIGPAADRGGAMGGTVVVVTVAALTGLLILGARLLRSGETVAPEPGHSASWLRRTSLLLTLLSALGILWTTLPTVILPACAV